MAALPLPTLSVLPYQHTPRIFLFRNTHLTGHFSLLLIQLRQLCFRRIHSLLPVFYRTRYTRNKDIEVRGCHSYLVVVFPCVLAIISSATERGASSYRAKCIEYSARP